MANFNDLPKPVREQIYHLHLVHDEPLTLDQHRKLVDFDWDQHPLYSTPAILKVSKKIEKEAAAFYCSRNHFQLPHMLVEQLNYTTYPRHRKLIRQITCSWTHAGYASSGFRTLANFKGLEELNIRVDEKAMIRCMCYSRDKHHRSGDEEPTPQQQLTVLRYPGMAALLSLSGISQVHFIKLLDNEKNETGGPIPGGVLETQVRSKITAPKVPDSVKRYVFEGSGLAKMRRKLTEARSSNDSFPFLSLPAEVRNHVYDFLLHISGAVSPSTQPPNRWHKLDVYPTLEAQEEDDDDDDETTTMVMVMVMEAIMGMIAMLIKIMMAKDAAWKSEGSLRHPHLTRHSSTCSSLQTRQGYIEA